MKKDYQPIIEYVEGEISAEEFHKELLNNLSLKKVISKFHCEMSTLKDYDYNLYKFLMNDWRFKSSNWDNISTRYYLSWWLGVFLKNNGIEYTPLMKYEQEYNFLLDIQPTWLEHR